MGISFRSGLRGRAWVGLLLLLSGCLAPEVEVAGKACDAAHVCPEAYTCRVDRRIATDGGAGDGG